jgi:beta-ureidopropionase / N-carbamoyl-L-amino-acid hydrolase
MSFDSLWDDLAGIGRDGRRGGFSRHGFDDAELTMRAWFTEQAGRRGLDVYPDANGNLWAWWGPPGAGAVVTGSHLDSVPGGGAYDGPLGVVSALLAVDALRASGFRPARPLAIVVFAEEEGGRFGVPCLGSRLLTGALRPSAAFGLRDPDGGTLACALRRAGFDPERVGRDAAAVARIGTFVELHVEQGKGLVRLDAPIGLAHSIMAHGRWRLTFSGEGNHAGTTALSDRRDPMLPAAQTVLEARRIASTVDGARATVGRIEPNPGGANVIASTVDVWLDARAPSASSASSAPSASDVRGVVDEIVAAAHGSAMAAGCILTVREESYGDPVVFDSTLRDRLADLLGGAPALPTGAGHDAGILAAAHVPTAMLFVRNPTGVSHAPAEHADRADCLAGVDALTTVLRHLTTP